jgi:anthranilate phosphoribosyltransferase
MTKLKKAKPNANPTRTMSLRFSERESYSPSEPKFSNRDSNSNKRSTVGPQTIAEMKSILENQIANRQYQLVNALILQSEKRQVNNWEEAIKRLGQVLRIDIENKKKNLQRIVKSHIMISNAFLGQIFKGI